MVHKEGIGYRVRKPMKGRACEVTKVRNPSSQIPQAI